MIGRLRGIVSEKSPPYFILDVSGVGYLIQTPLSTFEHIHEGQEIVLYTQCLIKDEETFVFGFLQKNELKMFQDLISVSGVGPKSALNFLSRFTPDQISEAIDNENLDLLITVPKIGRKLASKIVLELKGKLKFADTPAAFNQAVTALCSLGLSRVEATQRLKGLPTDVGVEELVKLALRK
jgi:Holliday junction DNA helicase RuvA